MGLRKKLLGFRRAAAGFQFGRKLLSCLLGCLSCRVALKKGQTHTGSFVLLFCVVEKRNVHAYMLYCLLSASKSFVIALLAC